VRDYNFGGMHTPRGQEAACARARPGRAAGALLALACTLGPALAQAGTYHVSERGSDEGPGSAQAPWKTLQHAAERVQPGDTVVIEPGIHDGFELERSGRPDARIRFVGKPGAIVDRGPEHGSRDNINLEGASYIDIEGLEVTSAWRAGIRAVECQHVHVRKNHVHDNGVWGVFTGFCDDLRIEDNVISGARRQHGIYVSNSPKRAVIRGNRIFDNRQAGIHLNGDASMGREGMVIDALVENNLIHGNGVRGGAGINCDGCRGAVFRNNILYDNHANGITLYRIDAAAPSTGNKVVHNTIWMSARSRWCIRIVDGSVENRFANNICLSEHPTRGAIDIDEASLRGFTSDNNALIARFTTTDGNATLALDGWRKKTGQDRRSITLTPTELFVSPEQRDLRLRPGCAAIDKGLPDVGVQNDYFGNRRPVGRAVDIGAIESCTGSACQRIYPHVGPPLVVTGTAPAVLPAGTSAAEAPGVAGGPGMPGVPGTPAMDDGARPAQAGARTEGAGGHEQGQAGAVSEAPAAPRPTPVSARPGGRGCLKAQATAEPPASSVALAALVLVLVLRRRRRAGRARSDR
jgi:uncharacterized protein (TIGR03382 family)